MREPNHPPDTGRARRAAFILTIWSQESTAEVPVWRGSLEAPSGRRWYFGSLDQLKELVARVGGWCEGDDEALTAG